MNQYPASNYHDLNLDWLLQQMKQCLAEWADTKEDWTNLEADNTEFKAAIEREWDEFKDYLVDTYLPQNIEADVAAYIAGMAVDGSLLEIITHDDGEGSALSDTVGVWLNAHITQETGYVIDDTLTVSGAAADAKVTGDRLTDLKSQSNQIRINTWNLWDSLSGLSNTNPVTGTTVSYLVHSPIIPVTEGQYYSVGIINNPLINKVMALSMRFYASDNSTIGNAISLYRQGGYLKWIQAPENATQAVVMYNTNNASVALTPNEIYIAGFKSIFANKLVNFSNRDSSGLYAVTEDEWIESQIVNNEKVKHITNTIVTVGATNSNFTNLRTALDAIKNYGGGNEYCQFEVRIKEGTYDISSYYTTEEKAQEDYVGLVVPDWIILKGVGNREKTILQYVLESDDSHICVLNLQNTCGLENLTLYGVHTRYCVHDDKANELGKPYTRYCKNVHFKGDHMAYGAVYGAGIKSNAEWTFENCIFESLTEQSYQNCFSVHGSQIAQVGSNLVKFINCRFIGSGTTNNALILSTLMNNAGYYQNYCELAGCQANGRLILREENASTYGAGIAWWATGYACVFTDKIVNHTDSEDYSNNIDII